MTLLSFWFHLFRDVYKLLVFGSCTCDRLKYIYQVCLYRHDLVTDSVVYLASICRMAVTETNFQKQLCPYLT